MRVPILHKYVFREMLFPFLVCLFVFTGILFLARILKLVELVITKNVPISDILLLFSYVVPRFMVIAIPMSIMLAVLLAFGRLSADSEIVVMRSIGLSLRRLAQPVMTFALGATLLTLALAAVVEPWANHRLGVGLFEIAKLRASAGLVAGAFNEFGKVTLYAENISDGGTRLESVIISDRRGPEVQNFLANHGQIVSDDERRTVTIQLYDGSIHSGSGLNYNLTYFDINRLELDPEQLADGGAREQKKLNELSFAELNKEIVKLGGQLAAMERSAEEISAEEHKAQLKEYAKHRTEWHRRFAIPTACLFVSFVAMALGIQPSRGGSTWGPMVNVMVGVAIVILYYFLFAITSTLSLKPGAPLVLLVWLPNLLFGGLGLLLFKLMQSERWLTVSDLIGHSIEGSQRWLAKKLHIAVEDA